MKMVKQLKMEILNLYGQINGNHQQKFNMLLIAII